MENEIDYLEQELAELIQENQSKEAQAVKGYTEQLAVISKLIDLATDSDKKAFLEKLKAETEEKISDELNHQKGLLEEYVEFTGIKIKED